MVDNICEPFMAAYGKNGTLEILFGMGKGSGAALMMFILGVSGSLICVVMGKKLKKFQLENDDDRLSGNLRILIEKEKSIVCT